MDSKKIEKAAVLAVEALIQQCDCIDPKIPTDDKNILVDGTLDIYSSPDLAIRNFVDKIDIQVKGTTQKLKPNKRGFVKYAIATENLRLYSSVYHGILFFCVSVGTREETNTNGKVYFAQLLPYDIEQILSEIPDTQKNVSVRFRPFPTEPREISRLLTAFRNDRNKQMRAEITGYGFLDKNKDLPPNIESISFSTQLFPGEDVTSLAGIRNGAYVYGKSTEGRVLVVGKFEDVCMFAKGMQAMVRTGDFEKTTTVLSGEHEDGLYLEIENVSFVMSDCSATLNYNVKGGFRQRYNTVHFMSEFLKTGELYINGNQLLRAEMSEESTRLQLQQLGPMVRSYKEIVDTLDSLSIAIDWDPSRMTEKEVADIGLMHKLLVDKKPLKNTELSSPLIHFDIQGTKVYAFAKQNDDGSYSFFNLHDEDLFFVFGWPDAKAADKRLGFDPVPPLAVISREGFKTIANIDPCKFEEAFSRFPITPGNQSPLNNKLLDILLAFDEGCKQPEAVLACAVVLAKKLYEFDPSSTSYYLNLIQTIKRKRALAPEEKRHLMDIAIDNPSQVLKTAAYMLLDDSEMASHCFNRCNRDEKRQLTDYPIWHFSQILSSEEK